MPGIRLLVYWLNLNMQHFFEYAYAFTCFFFGSKKMNTFFVMGVCLAVVLKQACCGEQDYMRFLFGKVLRTLGSASLPFLFLLF